MGRSLGISQLPDACSLRVHLHSSMQCKEASDGYCACDAGTDTSGRQHAPAARPEQAQARAGQRFRTSSICHGTGIPSIVPDSYLPLCVLSVRT